MNDLWQNCHISPRERIIMDSTPAPNPAIKSALLDAARRVSDAYPATAPLTASVVDVQDEDGGPIVQTRLDYESPTRAGVAIAIDWRENSVWFRTEARPGDEALAAFLAAADVTRTLAAFVRIGENDDDPFDEDVCAWAPLHTPVSA